MAEENQDGQEFLPPERLKAQFGIELTKKYGNYQKTLDELKKIDIGEDNIEEVQKLMKGINSFLKSSDDLRKEMKEPFFRQGKTIDDVYKEFSTPIEFIKADIQKRLNEAATAKAKKLEVERQRLIKEQQVKESINTFILDNSVKIASADSNEQLISLERLINLEKANKSKYGDLLPLLIERCNELNSKLAEQKVLVKQKEELLKQQAKAKEAGDDDKLNELKAKEQAIESQIADNTVTVQEQAANSIITSSNELDELDEVKARRTVWKAEISDVKEVMKKAPQMLDISLNTEKIREAIATLKDAGTFKGKTEIVVNGIRYFESKTF